MISSTWESCQTQLKLLRSVVLVSCTNHSSIYNIIQHLKILQSMSRINVMVSIGTKVQQKQGLQEHFIFEDLI